MISVAPSTKRSWSVSSIRSRKSPPSCLVIRYAYRAVLKLPTCMRPVGLGAYLVLNLPIFKISLMMYCLYLLSGQYKPYFSKNKGLFCCFLADFVHFPEVPFGLWASLTASELVLPISPGISSGFCLILMILGHETTNFRTLCPRFPDFLGIFPSQVPPMPIFSIMSTHFRHILRHFGHFHFNSLALCPLAPKIPEQFLKNCPQTTVLPN